MLASSHKSNLFGMINRRLENRDSSVSDSMICAVALLAGSEASESLPAGVYRVFLLIYWTTGRQRLKKPLASAYEWLEKNGDDARWHSEYWCTKSSD